MGIISLIKEVSFIAKELTAVALRPSWSRDKRLQNPARLTDERLNWILAIGAPFVEHMIEPGYQDVLTVFPPEEKANARLVKRLRLYESDSASRKDLMTYLDELENDSLSDEDSILLWYQIAPSRRAEALNLTRQEDSDHEEVWSYLYETNIDHSNTDLRLYELISATLKVRVACFLSVIPEEECMQILERLAGKIERRLAGVENWSDFAEKIQAGWQVDGKVEGEDDYLQELQQDKDSLWHHVPFDAGWSLPEKRKDRVYSNLPLANYKSKVAEIYGRILSCAKEGNFEEAFEMIEVELSKDGDENFLEEMIGMFSPDDFGVEQIDSLPDRLKDQPLALLARANWFKDWAWMARGTGTSDTVGDQGYQRFFERLGLAWKDLQKARDALPEEPTVLSMCFEILPHLDEDNLGTDSYSEKQLILSDLQARFPGFQPAYVSYFHFQASKWGGDFDDELKFVNHIADEAPEGSVVPLLAYQVVLQEWEYYENFFEDEDEDDIVESFAKRDDVNETLDKWFEPLLAAITPKNEYAVLSALSCWYNVRKDTARLEIISDAMSEPVLYDGSFWDDVYKREFVVATLNRIYYS